MKIEKFSYHFELSPSQNFQKATVGITTEVILEEGDSYEECLENLKKSVRIEVWNEASKSLDLMVRNSMNKGRDV